MSRYLSSAAFLLALLLTAGCTTKSYENVEDGHKGPTSPRESGEQGARSDLRPPYGSPGTARDEHKIVPYERAFTNGFTTPAMENSGNLAAQGNYPLAQQSEQPTWDGNTAR